ncbi:MAG TPA: hypothetical protein VMT30_05880 [Candidatus Saccharimonadia bacterium]|nr:hypothetical protein [Candidatus Saccharimonadia bacterium]
MLRLKAWGILPPEARRRTVAGLVIQMLDEVLGNEVMHAWDIYRTNPGCSSHDFQDACQQLLACRGIEMTPGKD